jgi:hypothetical protein
METNKGLYQFESWDPILFLYIFFFIYFYFIITIYFFNFIGLLKVLLL